MYPFKKKLIDALERRKKNAQSQALIDKLKDKEDQPAFDEEHLLEANNKPVFYEETKGGDDENSKNHLK